MSLQVFYCEICKIIQNSYSTTCERQLLIQNFPFCFSGEVQNYHLTKDRVYFQTVFLTEVATEETKSISKICSYRSDQC